MTCTSTTSSTTTSIFFEFIVTISKLYSVIATESQWLLSRIHFARYLLKTRPCLAVFSPTNKRSTIKIILLKPVFDRFPMSMWQMHQMRSSHCSDSKKILRFIISFCRWICINIVWTAFLLYLHLIARFAYNVQMETFSKKVSKRICLCH